MHQIQFRLGLGTALPRTPWLDLRGLLLREGRKKGEKWEGIKGEEKEMGGEWDRAGNGRKGEERRGHSWFLLTCTLLI